MNRPMDSKPAEVLPALQGGAAKQAGDVRAKWAWTDPSVWTNRMLAALEKGVKGDCWFSLIDKVYSPGALRNAFEKVKRNAGAAGVDHQTVGMFERDLETNLEKLASALKDGTYRPQDVKRVWIPKPGSTEERPLGIPTVRDRVVQTAMRAVMEPIFERDFAEHSYGFRPGRGCKDALRRVDELLKAGYEWVVDADLKSYFDTIPHAPLMARVGARISDGRMLRLIESFLTQNVLDGLERWTPDAGSPQGAVISPLLSNIYLDPLDHRMAQNGIEMVRYADDLVMLCRSREQAEDALARMREWTEQAGLTLHPEKTRIVQATVEGFEFLGYRFEQGRKGPRPKSLAKFKAAIREQTPRNHGQSLRAIITAINRTVRGWFEYFKHSHKWTFRPLDNFIRLRLRRILLKRKNRSGGWPRQAACKEWPNGFFAEAGVMSLVKAHAEACQPLPR